MAREVFEYELSDDAADTAARVLGAMTAGLSRLEVPRDLQPPFGYPTMLAEAGRLRERKS
jgi:hypothetical protein